MEHLFIPLMSSNHSFCVYRLMRFDVWFIYYYFTIFSFFISFWLVWWFHFTLAKVYKNWWLWKNWKNEKSIRRTLFTQKKAVNQIILQNKIILNEQTQTRTAKSDKNNIIWWDTGWDDGKIRHSMSGLITPFYGILLTL